RIDAHARQTDLALRAFRMLIGEGGQLLFIGAPTHLGCCSPLLAKSFHAPGIDELADLFGLIGDLCVALAAVNDFDAEVVRQMIELLSLGMVGDFFCLSAAELPVRQSLMSDVQKRMFSKMTD